MAVDILAQQHPEKKHGNVGVFAGLQLFLSAFCCVKCYLLLIAALKRHCVVLEERLQL